MTIRDTDAARRPHRRRRTVSALLAVAALALTGLYLPQSVAAGEQLSRSSRPTVVLVHGAWADASSWSRVTSRLQDDGYTVRAIPNPLRSLPGDSASVRSFLESLSGPIVLVGHSYGGAVVTNAATGNPNVKALVYVNAFAPDEGESALDLAGADSALSGDPTTLFDFVPPDLPPTAGTDLYLKRAVVLDSFASGLSRDEKLMVWATQRPATLGALAGHSGEPAWRTIPSWYLVGVQDKIITVSSQRAMAARAGSTVTEYQGGHLGLASEAGTVTRIIETAARAGTRTR